MTDLDLDIIPDLTAAEKCLAVALTTFTAGTGAAYLQRHRYPTPSDAEWSDLRRRQIEAIAAFVLRIREPGVVSVDPDAIADDLDAWVTGIVEGTVLAVMGRSPASPTAN